jgi:serine/threonine-protein kinase
LIKTIGEGASGTVWSAEHVELGRNFAIKVLLPEHGSAPGPMERFRREARVLAALSHANLAYLHDFGRALDGRMFLVMELLEGETLDVRGRRPWRECLELGMQVCSALEAAHGAGLVHRDLKPHNLFLTKTGTVKLLDFGVAQALSDTADQKEKPRGFAIFGTPEYMAPEQISGEPVDGRADLYALGCVLYELMTGERPFEGPSSVVVLGKQLREDPIAPRARIPEIPAKVEAIVLQALAKRPEERFVNANAMRAAIRELLEGPAKSAWVKNAPRAVALAAIAGAMLVGLGATASSPQRPQAALPVPVVDSAPAPLPAPPPQTTLAAAPTPSPPSVAVSSLPVAAKEKDKDNRLESLRAAAHTHPSDPRKLKAWAQAARAAGELKEARHAADAWALHDGTPEPKIFLAQLLDQMGHRGEAQAVLEEILEKYPDSSDARRLHAKLGPALPDPHRTATR